MIEIIIYDFLNQMLGVTVYTERREEIGNYCVIEKVGGGETDYIKRASVAIQSYSETLYGAAELNEAVKNVMRYITELDAVSSCSLDSDYNYTDEQTKKYRYQAVYDLTYY